MDPVKYQHLRSAGGACHFARIAIQRKSADGVMNHPDNLRSWIDAAHQGIQDGRTATQCEDELEIVSFEGTMVDTGDDDAWACALMAVLTLAGRGGHLIYDEGWTCILDTGDRIRCPLPREQPPRRR